MTEKLPSEAVMSDFVKVPCKHCPFRSDVTPFLHPERAAEIAFSAQNPYASFTCHKTLDYDDEGDTCVTEESLECAGRLSMLANSGNGSAPEGFKPSDLVYGDADEMVMAYEDEWYERKGREAS